MPPSIAPERGFTLIELLVVFILFGLLTALMAPSFSKFKTRYEVQGAFQQIQQILREAQREAIHDGQTCTVTLNLSNSPITISAQNQSSRACAISRTLPENIQVKTNLTATDPQVSFSYQGTATLKDTNKLNVVVYWPDQPDLEKPCLVLTAGIGIIRTGQYKETVDTKLNTEYCEPPQSPQKSDTTPTPFAIAPQPSTSYYIVNRLTGKALEGLGVAVAQYPRDGSSAAQVWQFQPVGNGFYRIMAQRNQKILEIAGGENNRANGASLQLGTLQSAAKDQQWQIQPIGNGYVILQNHNTGKVIDLPGNNSNFVDGALVQQWEYQNELDQQWLLDPVK